MLFTILVAVQPGQDSSALRLQALNRIGFAEALCVDTLSLKVDSTCFAKRTKKESPANLARYRKLQQHPESDLYKLVEDNVQRLFQAAITIEEAKENDRLEAEILGN